MTVGARPATAPTPSPPSPNGPHGRPGDDGRRHGDRLVLSAGSDRPGAGSTTLFGDGPVVTAGRPGLARRSSRPLTPGRHSTWPPAWPGAPRSIDAEICWPSGCWPATNAPRPVAAAVYAPLAAAPSPLLATMEAYLATGGALEPTARNLFVHPNTVRTGCAGSPT